jgi:hypothetical protein
MQPNGYFRAVIYRYSTVVQNFSIQSGLNMVKNKLDINNE